MSPKLNFLNFKIIVGGHFPVFDIVLIGVKIEKLLWVGVKKNKANSDTL